MPALLPLINMPQSGSFAMRGSSTILLVDDDPNVLRLLSDLLTRDGYAVLPCSSGAAAAASFRANGHIDLLLTDFQMPGMTGIELANLLTATRPDLAVLLVSGSPADDLPLWELWRKKWCFLSKPLNPSLLLKTISYLCGPLPNELQNGFLQSAASSCSDA